MEKQKIVILFTRLSDYMLNVFQHWVETSDVELYVFKREVDAKEAPFKFGDNFKNIHLFNEAEFTKSSLLEKVTEINPKMILCAGWMDKRYLHTVSQFSGKIPTVMSMDTQWNSKLRQYVAMIASRLFLTKKFSHVWVPGLPQVNYAEKLGFKTSQILQGFYVANQNNFSRELINPDKVFKKRFIFLGRYVDIKGIRELWQAFTELQDESPNEWELLCIGAGPLFEERVIHPKIKHMGFIQPKELKKYMSDGGVFVLPSHYEPWGVVVHEFALAGFPMIISDAVGAASEFVDEKNGVIFEKANKEQLKIAMKKMMKLPLVKLVEMSDESYEKAKIINEEEWVLTVNAVLNSKGRK